MSFSPVQRIRDTNLTFQPDHMLAISCWFKPSLLTSFFVFFLLVLEIWVLYWQAFWWATFSSCYVNPATFCYLAHKCHVRCLMVVLPAMPFHKLCFVCNKFFGHSHKHSFWNFPYKSILRIWTRATSAWWKRGSRFCTLSPYWIRIFGLNCTFS